MDNLKNLDCLLKKKEFMLIGIPEMNKGKYEYALFDEKNLVTNRVRVDSTSMLVELISGSASTMVYLDSPVFSKKMEAFLTQLNIQPSFSEEYETGRLIKEIKTLRLQPEDRLLVTLKNEELPEDPRDRQIALDHFRESLLCWIGEKSNPGRVIVVVGDITLVKIRKEDVQNYQE